MWPQNVPSDRSLLGNQEDILFVCFWVVSGCVARVDSHQEGLHQSGGGLQAGHHLHRGPEASPHSPLLLGQSWEGADAFTPLSCRVPFDFCCAAVTVLITSCRLGRVAMSQRAPRWTAPSHTRPSSTSTCAAMLGFRWRIHESALFIDERVVPSFLLSVQFLKSYELFWNWICHIWTKQNCAIMLKLHYLLHEEIVSRAEQFRSVVATGMMLNDKKDDWNAFIPIS